MAAIERDEIGPGLTARLDQLALPTFGPILVKARKGIERVKEEDKFHSFLLIAYDDQNKLWLCAPLFSKWAVGNELLLPKYKSGPFPGWASDSYISPYQQWMLGEAAIIGASGFELTSKGMRSFYARANEAELKRLAQMRHANTAKWRRPKVSN